MFRTPVEQNFSSAHLVLSLLLLVPTVAAAQGQQPRSRPGWPCVGRPDPVYVRTAEATGGQVFLFDPSEIGHSAALMIAQQGHEETIFRISGSLEDGTHEFSFPIDSTVESAFISVSLQCLQVVEIAMPNGAVLRDSDPGVDYHQFQAGRIVTIKKPAPGSWKVTVSGKGMFFLVAQAKSDLSLDGVEFVEVAGRPGHEGYFPIKGQPRRGVEQTLEVRMSGSPSASGFAFYSSQGELLQRLTLAAEEDVSGDDRAYLGKVTPQAAEFRLAVTGLDARGFRFERMKAALITTRAPE
jgi:hypothetical protein